MSATLKADGDTWRARLGGTEGERIVLFFCVTTDQRPYRVIRVGTRFASDEDLTRLSADELRELFDGTSSMGAPTPYPTYGA